MKLQSGYVKINLGVLVNLFLFSSTSCFLFSSSLVRSQETTSSCPLPSDIAVTFLDSKCEAITLKQPQTYYRYYSSDSNKYGRYLTTEKYETNVEVIRKLALNQSWQPPNKATLIEKVTLPAETKVYIGIVAPQTPAKCYPGGGKQVFIQDSKDTNIKWSDGENLVVKDFSCP